MSRVKERSAGAVVVRRTPAGRVVLLLRYGAGHWGFPKGHVEKGETEVQAAIREVEEETGIPRHELTMLDGFSGRTDYTFRRGRTLVAKSVVFFLVETATERVRVSPEHTDAAWVAPQEALVRLAFEGPRRLLVEAETFLDELERAKGAGVAGESEASRP